MASVVDKMIQKQREKLIEEVQKQLIKTAADSIYYVASGRVMRRELAERFGLTEQDAEGIICRVAVALVDKIKAF